MKCSILLVCKKIVLFLLLISLFGACATQRYKPKAPNKKRCNCPRFSQELFINTSDYNNTIELNEING